MRLFLQPSTVLILTIVAVVQFKKGQWPKPENRSQEKLLPQYGERFQMVNLSFFSLGKNPPTSTSTL